MGCLDEQTVVAFVNGALTGRKLADAEKHLLGCPDCSTLVALAAPTSAPRQITLKGPGAPSTRELPETPPSRTVPSPSPDLTAGPLPTWSESQADGSIVDMSSAEVPRPGGTVGRYRLLQLVGRGGMGEVYAAHDPELDRRIAIKIMRADTLPNDVEAQRMMREAQAIAKLSHPNLVTVYDVGTEGHRVFVAMELIEGDTVAAWLDRKRRSRDEILRVFIAAGRGLAAAHRAGIIHRDFKPHNVMVAADGAVRVMDFGLAALRQTLHGPKAQRITRIGSILGTPLYMSPEQLCGQSVDPRADQFGFCVALYEALYGERPFGGDNFAELRAAVLEGRPRPAPLSSRVPARLRAILLRGLSVVPGRRHPDMETLLKALEQFTVRRLGLARILAIGAAAGGLAFGLAFGTVWQLRGGTRVSSRCAGPPAKLAAAWPTAADAPRRAEIRAAFLAAGNVPDARERFERASQSLDNYANAWTGSYRQYCEAADTGDADAREAAALRMGCLDQRAVRLGALAESFAHADAKIVRKSVAATLALPALDSCADARTLKNIALPSDPALRELVQSLRDRLATLWATAASGHDWQALKPMGALIDEVRAVGHDPLLAEALIVYARIRSPFDPEGAETVYEEAFKRGEAIHNDELAAEAAIQLITITGAVSHHFDTGERWARVADTTIERGVPLRMRGSFLNNRGTLFAAKGAWRLAEADFTAAVAIRRQALGAAHPDLAASLINQARAVLVLDDPKRALEIANKAFAITAAFFPAESYEVGAARLVRGQSLIALNRMGEAGAEMQAVLETFERALGRDHPFLADPMTGLGEVALAEHRPSEAQGLLERAWEIRSTHTTDGGIREETAFRLAQAIWDAAPADRNHALELAAEARDGYGDIPDMASRLAMVNRWLAERADHHPSHASARSASGSRSQTAGSLTRPKPAPAPPETPPAAEAKTPEPTQAKTPEPTEEDQPARL
jgi:tRNA A-37 threonylcarbamoyl transferase component Bud32/tetratricopeptide (TPR) repeat protein